MEVQVYDFGNTKNCCELSEIDVGLVMQWPPHDPPAPNSRGGFKMKMLSYTNANQGSRGSLPHQTVLLTGIKFIFKNISGINI